MFVVLALVAAIVSYFGSIAVWKIGLKYRLYPKIRERDVHTRPTPRLGGIAMYVGFVAAIGVAWVVSARFPLLDVVFDDRWQVPAILLAATLIVVLGVADDLWDLDWTAKLAGQFIAAGIIAWQGVSILSLPIAGFKVIGSSLFSVIITVFAIVLVMNAMNFIDGLDGLVAGVSLIANGVFFVYTYLLVQQSSPTNYMNLASLLAALVVGVCIGFLPLNWHPAKLFMGDAGSLLLGLLMATSAIAVTGQIDPATVGQNQLVAAFIPIVIPFAVLVIPLLDFGLAVVRRMGAGRSPFSADRKHLHHRLLDMGHSSLGAVLIFYAWTAVASIGCLLTYVLPVYFGVDDWVAFVILGLGFVVCAVLTLAPLGKRRHWFTGWTSFRRARIVESTADVEGVDETTPAVPAGERTGPVPAASEADPDASTPISAPPATRR
nr:MraY family glycosyltransferase [Agromyces seonyuensis]